VRCASAFARLVLAQVGEAEKEPHRDLAGGALPGALEDVDRLVGGTELVAGDPEPHDRVQPIGITGERLREQNDASAYRPCWAA